MHCWTILIVMMKKTLILTLIFFDSTAIESLQSDILEAVIHEKYDIMIYDILNLLIIVMMVH